MQMVISGVEEALARALIDQGAWREAGACWVAPDELVRLLETATDRPDHGVAWFYRSPMTELLSVSESAPGNVQGVLDRWWVRNRVVLDFHRRDSARSILMNVDRVRRAGVPSGLLGVVVRTTATEEGVPDATPEDPAGIALQRLLELDFPRCIELFEALEASSWLPQEDASWFRGAGAEPAGVELARITAAFASIHGLRRRVEELDDLSARQQHELESARTKATDYLRENELLLLQLRSLQEDVRRTADHDQAGALRARVEELELQVKLLRKPLAQHLALLGTHDGSGLRIRLARMLVPPGSLALARIERRNRIEEMRNSAWFDAEWYMNTYKDVANEGTDPAVHYYDWGWLEGRDPGPGFSTAHYLRRYPDVAESGLNPLWHFAKYGEQEGRTPAPASSN